MRELQIQEKLYAYNERFAEAHQIRQELPELEVSEQNRIENKILENQEKKRKKILRSQKAQKNQIQQKNQENYNKLLIKYEQEKTRLEKEVKLHYHDIKKTQKLGETLAIQKGKHRDELRRLKQNAKSLQNFIKNARAIANPNSVYSSRPFQSQISPKLFSPQVSNIPSKSYNVFQINKKSLTHFNINSKKKFSNAPSTTSQLSALTDRKTTDLLLSVTSLYNTNLESLE